MQVVMTPQEVQIAEDHLGDITATEIIGESTPAHATEAHNSFPAD